MKWLLRLLRLLKKKKVTCEVGNHLVPDYQISRCHHCKKSCCFAHQGNRRTALAGDYISCTHPVCLEAVTKENENRGLIGSGGAYERQ